MKGSCFDLTGPAQISQFRNMYKDVSVLTVEPRSTTRLE